MTAEIGEKRKPINIEAIMRAVPSDIKFKTGAELQSSSHHLTEDFPDLVQRGFLTLDKKFGVSSAGRDIELMTVGKGKKKVMWVGTPHPNEAVGTVTIDFLSRYLCEYPEVTEQLDTTFIFIKNGDPDGLELNKSWLQEEMDPVTYALGFYRPPYGTEFEWGFPIHYKTLHFSEEEASNESRTVKKAFDLYTPEFYYALHNYGLGGASFNMEPPLPEVFSPLQQLIHKNTITLHTGEAESPYQKKYADGIYQIANAKNKYEYYSQKEGDPADSMSGGAKALEYLLSISPNAIGLVPEIPYFTADILRDTSLSGKTRRDAMLETISAKQRIIAFMEKQFNELKSKVEIADSPLKDAVEGRIKVMKNVGDINKIEAEKPEYQQEVTNADMYTAVHISSFFELIQLGQVYQLAIQAGEIGQAEQIKHYIKQGIEEINKVSEIKAVPLQTLVAIQVGAGLLVQQQLALAA